jgi:transcriptional regulator with XRE-family HTH domain
MSSEDETPLGAYIRRQRELQEMTVRQLAKLAGISNPYLSQIERGLREPSEQVLDAIAQQLEVSADALKAHDRRGDERDDEEEEPAVVAAIREDPALTARQRRALLEVYAAFSGYDPRRRRRTST